jgi:hypothetical protein
VMSWPCRASALHRPRQIVAWPFPQEELTVSPKMTILIVPDIRASQGDEKLLTI